MTFKKWLATFVDEKGIDPEKTFSFEENGTAHIMPIGTVLEFMGDSMPATQQADCKRTIVKIDFLNRNVEHFLLYLARGIAKFHAPAF